jgi:hypothetical protein
MTIPIDPAKPLQPVDEDGPALTVPPMVWNALLGELNALHEAQLLEPAIRQAVTEAFNEISMTVSTDNCRVVLEKFAEQILSTVEPVVFDLEHRLRHREGQLQKLAEEYQKLAAKLIGTMQGIACVAAERAKATSATKVIKRRQHRRDVVRP